MTKTAKYGTGSPETTTYTYDEARATYYNVGRLTTAANAAATITYDFDKDGRQVRQQYVVDSTTHTITDSYDIGGRLLSRTYPDSDSVGTITYDAAGRLKTVPSLVSDTLYDARSQVTSLTRVNTVNSTYSYSAQRGWLTGVSTVKSATVLQDYTYGRDAMGRITGVTSSQAGEGWTYGYDDMDRLLSADNTTDNSLDQTWTYDTVDNMLTNSLVGTYSYPTPGTARPHAVTGLSGGLLGTQSFTYDDNGNMTDQDGNTREYDGENRLVTAIDGLTTTQFVYGPDGARLKKIVGTTVTLYLGADIEKKVTPSDTTWTKYLPGDARKVVNSTVNAVSWLHRDHLQSVRLETDGTGAPASGTASQYRPFGERKPPIATTTEPKGFIGERHDIETGLMYLNARYYDPALGRFMSADPSDPIAAGVGVNRYAYAFNSPVIMLDPSGLGSNWQGNEGNNNPEGPPKGSHANNTCGGDCGPNKTDKRGRAYYGWDVIGGWFGVSVTTAYVPLEQQPIIQLACAAECPTTYQIYIGGGVVFAPSYSPIGSPTIGSSTSADITFGISTDFTFENTQLIGTVQAAPLSGSVGTSWGVSGTAGFSWREGTFAPGLSTEVLGHAEINIGAGLYGGVSGDFDEDSLDSLSVDLDFGIGEGFNVSAGPAASATIATPTVGDIAGFMVDVENWVQDRALRRAGVPGCCN